MPKDASLEQTNFMTQKAEAFFRKKILFTVNLLWVKLVAKGITINCLQIRD
jgi:hypothetical protein